MIRLFIFIFIIWLINSCTFDPVRESIDLSNAPDTVQMFGPHQISTALYERDLAIGSDGNELIFTRGDYRQNRRCLMRMKKEGARWTDPEVLPFSGAYQDIEPFISPKGDLLYFSSNRPFLGEDRTDYNIWVAKKMDGSWTSPQPLDTIINQTGDEFFPSVSDNGSLYFTAVRPDGIGLEDIFLSEFHEGQYQIPIPLDAAINSKAYEFNAYVSPQEDLLIFSSYGRMDDQGGGDLYFSKKIDGVWSEARNLAYINSPKLDYCPFVDFNHRIFYFTSERMLTIELIESPDDLARMANRPGNGLGDLYRISLDKLDIR